jgi:hypothetical protein
LCLAVGVLLVGCKSVTGADSSQISLKQVSAAIATRTVSLHISGPIELASGGRILNDGGGGVIAPGGANVVAAGGGNVIAAGGANFRIFASTEQFASVEKASVQLFTLEGKPDGKLLEADAQGKVEVKAKNQPMLAISNFKVGDKTYRVAAVLAAEKDETSVEHDPINTMVEARVRQIVGTNQKVSAMTFAKLKRVWMICNGAGITVAKEDLDASASDADSLTRLNAVWKEAIDSKVTDQAQKDEIKAFIAELQAAVK